MSVFGLERSSTSTANAYDHAINLVDATKPAADIEANLDEPSSPDSISASRSSTLLSRQWTKTGIRQELARRKYAKWQEDKSADAAMMEVSGAESNDENSESSQAKPARQSTARRGRLRDMIPFKNKKKIAASNKDQDTFIDVLYENQRGSFIFGIPLYSSQSLLNLDPAGWQTSTFQDSAVDITNAQVPDPSWAWDWRTWYVDMSYDVDEEGWQYSFSFGSGFAWHGNHPWFHSFVRRRRWLRKRVRVGAQAAQGKKESMNEAHLLNADYFTIHAGTREKSRGSSADRNASNRSSVMGKYANEDENKVSLEEIGDIAALTIAMKQARVDREKIAAIRAFLDQGGDELFYLAGHMPAIMDDFIHQTSRRQAQTQLLQALDEASKNKEKIGDDPEKEESAKRRVDYLLKAINAAGVDINEKDHWSDLRGQFSYSETGNVNETDALDAPKPAHISGEESPGHISDDEGDVRDEIKGIPALAQISQEPRIGFSMDQSTLRKVDKGKGKA